MGIWIIVGIFVFLILLVIYLYNHIVSLHNRVKNAWASIDNQLKRRSDLIPNLLEVTKGYAKHESEVLENIVFNRNGGSILETAKQSEMISASLNHLFAVSEAYPDLKANEVFLKLQVELVGTEDKIAYARQFYNDCVQRFNTSIQMFPNNVVASILHFQEEEYFQVSDEDKKMVDVKL